MIIALLALTASEPATVSYSNPGARLERLLPELSAATGLELEADKKISDVVLTLRLDNASVKETLAKVAEATRGAWSVHGGKWKLYEDAAGIDRAQAAAEERHKAGIHEMLIDLHKAIEPKPPAKDDEEAPSPPTPAEILIAKLCDFFDGAGLEKLPLSDRFVFSTRPRAMQHALPRGCESLFEDFVKGEKSQPKLRRRGETPVSTGDPFKSDITVTRRTRRGSESFLFQVSVFDSAGKYIVQSWAGGGIPGADLEKTGLDPESESQSHVLQIPADMSARLLLQSPTQLTPKLRAILLNPLEHDPLEPIGSVLVAYAKAKNLELVASLTDGITNYMSEGQDFLSTSSVSWFLNSIHAKLQNGWLLLDHPITLADVPDDASDQTDRHQLQAVLAKVHDVRCPTLQMLVQSVRDGFLTIPMNEQMILFPNMTDTSVAEPLALLDDGLIDTLMAGRPIALNQTTPAFQAKFAEYCFASASPSMTIDDDTSNDSVNDYRSEPTEVTDLRVPPEAYIQLLRTDEAALEPSIPDPNMRNYGGGGYYTIASLANRLVYGDPMGAAKFRLGTNHNYELRYYLAPKLYWALTSTTSEVPADGSWITTLQLPVDLKKQLKDLVDGMGKDQRGGDGGGPPK